jgi:catechol 2,3-dioxygenase-like lactoylglutathione lyase family enzyme
MIRAIHHVQLAMPRGREDDARAFYRDVLGFTEQAKPENLARRGGAWFTAGDAHLHLGVEDDFRPAKKAHPALLVADLETLLARCRAAGYDVNTDEPLPGYDRAYVTDPFGNRIELLEPVPELYHGTRADLKPGDLIGPGYASNYGTRRKANYVYLSATLNAATWGAELAVGEGPGRIYTVEPTGPIEDDPNLTNKRFPGNPTKSYRSRDPLRVTGEVTDWQGHSDEELQAMKDHLEQLKARGVEAIEE